MRLIDVDEVQKIIGHIRTKYVDTHNQFFWDTIRYIEKKVRSIPTIEAAPVVRCKDCKYFRFRSCYRVHDKTEDRLINEGLADIVDNNAPVYNDFNPDDFCSYGEIKMDGKEQL